jgi:poly(A) polymerase
MAQAGALARALPGADHRALAPLVHLEAEAGCAPDPIRRLAALGGDDPGQALRLSKSEAKQLAALREAAESPAGAAELGYRLGAETAFSAILLRAALIGTPPPQTARTDATRGEAADFPVKSADLMPALQGAALGRKLSELEARWIASDFRLSRAALLA